MLSVPFADGALTNSAELIVTKGFQDLLVPRGQHSGFSLIGGSAALGYNQRQDVKNGLRDHL